MTANMMALLHPFHVRIIPHETSSLEVHTHARCLIDEIRGASGRSPQRFSIIGIIDITKIINYI
jgi:hypothetical protein